MEFEIEDYSFVVTYSLEESDIFVEDEEDVKGGKKLKIISINAYDNIEEENYNYVSLELNGVKYNFFYNYFLRDTDTFDADVLNWIVGLSTIAVNENTSLIDITNSAIGSSYEIEIYNYTPKTGKNAGKPQHGIQFSTTPKLVTVEIESEEFVLPY